MLVMCDLGLDDCSERVAKVGAPLLVEPVDLREVSAEHLVGASRQLLATVRQPMRIRQTTAHVHVGLHHRLER